MIVAALGCQDRLNFVERMWTNSISLCPFLSLSVGAIPKNLCNISKQIHWERERKKKKEMESHEEEKLLFWPQFCFQNSISHAEAKLANFLSFYIIIDDDYDDDDHRRRRCRCRCCQQKKNRHRELVVQLMCYQASLPELVGLVHPPPTHISCSLRCCRQRGPTDSISGLAKFHSIWFESNTHDRNSNPLLNLPSNSFDGFFSLLLLLSFVCLFVLWCCCKNHNLMYEI